MPRTGSKLVAVLASLLLMLGACGGDDDDGSAADNPDDAGGQTDDVGDVGDDGDDGDDGQVSNSGAGGGTATFEGNPITISTVRCFFEEQPRAGLGGVFTHTLQASGTDADGVEVIIDLTRARGEDGEVSDDASYDVGDPFGDDFVGYRGGGPEGTITFGDDGASATDLEVKNSDDFNAEPALLSFDLTC